MAEQERNDLNIPSTLNHSMILWFYVMLFWKLQKLSCWSCCKSWSCSLSDLLHSHEELSLCLGKLGLFRQQNYGVHMFLRKACWKLFLFVSKWQWRFEFLKKKKKEKKSGPYSGIQMGSPHSLIYHCIGCTCQGFDNIGTAGGASVRRGMGCSVLRTNDSNCICNGCTASLSRTHQQSWWHL